MKTLLSVLFSVFFLSSGLAQTMGIIECNGRHGISAWEKPDSIIVVEHLACGRTLPVVGTEEGFVKVQLGIRLFAYVNAENIRLVENARVPEKPVPAFETQGKFLPRKAPAATQSPELSQPAPDVAKLPLIQSKRDTVLKSGLEFGLDSSYIRYEEPDFMQEEGVTLSAYGSYTLRPADFMIRLEGRYGFAGVSYSSPVSGETKRIRDYIGEARALVGYTFEASDKWYLTPYTGFGYRYLFDGMGGKVTNVGHLGYDRRSNYFYSPIGFESANYLNYGWALVVTGEYALFWKGCQESDLGILFGGSPAIINDQDDGWGIRASGKFIKEMGRPDFVFGPYIKYWNIEDSDWAYLYYEEEELAFIEPANNSIEIGGMFGIAF
ncbi:MAG: autotransporter outer membrane beta-barrel domain-containing protein [Acidobacteria bacterium]|nr:autotransporter outer membrane beta-barrel domain-containing protein [Acidobacteriota bacterium]